MDALRRAALLGRRALDRARLRWLTAYHAGLEVHPSATPAFGRARFNLAPGGRVRIGAGAATESIPGALSFVVHPGAEVVVEDGAWLRTEVGPIVICAFPGAVVRVGPQVLLNGCQLSAKESLTIARRAMVGPGSRVYDSDQHDLDAERLERVAPVSIGECAWVASDVTVMRGVRIGAHAVVGARSVVTADVPDHALALGAPARVRGEVGDRSHAR